MKLNVNATRMEFLKLRKRTSIAKRGHKLLKDKQDELMERLLAMTKKVEELREKVEEELARTTKKFLLARAGMEPDFVEEALLIPTKRVEVELEEKNLLNVKIPVLRQSVSGEIISYGYHETSPELDAALYSLDKAIGDLLELAAMEKTLELIAVEIEKTRRRVNALEYILIPNLEETLRYIVMKLSEIERSTLSRLMRIKDIVRAH
ncbi:V-type ATP synthase subunit D [candidate division WOR-3 bacterium JGI_Cruoil_03_44_89]|uniref:V-type ATP synthase subunit D n=1 Tax=candidate division WOR-3 bacterium JGI_Cruoil_03_44_89 TaxID=1973748 RepID=A0A235BSE8_UNCW3|nr:MAG: V-type ATP synthase subunit D [candidate division WOR-3 bacterium JGI_Cruoil_03_44_89]